MDNIAIIAPADLASYLRLAEPDDWETIGLLCDLANGIVTELPTAFTDPPPTRVLAITLEVAARAYRNPEGYSSETVDDYTYRLPTETRRAGVYLTDAERSELLSLGVVAGASFLTVQVTSPLDVV